MFIGCKDTDDNAFARTFCGYKVKHLAFTVVFEFTEMIFFTCGMKQLGIKKKDRSLNKENSLSYDGFKKYRKVIS